MYTAMQSKNAKLLSFHFASMQLLPFGFAEQCTVMQIQNAVDVYFSNKQLLSSFSFALQHNHRDPLIDIEVIVDCHAPDIKSKKRR